MILKLNSTDLLKCLNHIYGIIEVRHTLPILSNIIIRSSDDLVNLSSTNLDIYFSENIKADINIGGETSVSAATFYEIVKRLPGGSDVHISHNEDDSLLLINCGRSKFKLSTIKTDDFPIINDSDLNISFVLTAQELSRMIDKTKFAISNEEARYYLKSLGKSIQNFLQPWEFLIQKIQIFILSKKKLMKEK